MKRKGSQQVDAWTQQQCALAVESLRCRLAPLRDGRIGPEVVGLVRVEGGSRGASVLSGQAVSGAAELICAVG
jgi:hypothetical protein